MNRKQLLFAVSAALLILGRRDGEMPARPSTKAGALACVTDKWDEKEVGEGPQAGRLRTVRCVDVPNDPAAPKYSQDCTGKYEYMPDGSWKAAGTCTDTFKSGDTKFEAWEEGSASQGIHLQDHRRHR